MNGQISLSAKLHLPGTDTLADWAHFKLWRKWSVADQPRYL